MATASTLPTIQNWSCHNCGGCCRQHLIEVTEEERQRIIAQNWTAADGIAADRPVLVPLSGFGRKKRYRLGHQSDGACVFLDREGAVPHSCEVRRTGQAPAVPHLSVCVSSRRQADGRQPAVQLSVRRREPGRPRAASRSGELQKIAAVVVPESAKNVPPPADQRSRTARLAGLLRFVAASMRRLPRPMRLSREAAARAVLDEHGRPIEVRRRARRAARRVPRPDDNRGIAGNRRQTPARRRTDAVRTTAVSHAGRPVCARKDTFVTLESGLAGRWRLLLSAMRSHAAPATSRRCRKASKRCRSRRSKRPFGGLSAEADEMLTRYFRVKIQGLHFCGPAYYDVPLVEGFQSLALVFPAVLWLARWLAASGGRIDVDHRRRRPGRWRSPTTTTAIRPRSAKVTSAAASAFWPARAISGRLVRLVRA